MIQDSGVTPETKFSEGFSLIEANRKIQVSVAAGGEKTLKSLIGALIAMGVTEEGLLMKEVGRIAGSHHDWNVGEALTQHCDGRGEDLWRTLPSGSLYLNLARETETLKN